MTSPARSEGCAWCRAWGRVAMERLPLLARVVRWWRDEAEIRRVERRLRIMLAKAKAEDERRRALTG